MNYEEDIQIDPNALDIAWLEQPTLMYKYAHEQAKISKQWDLAKEELALVRANLDKRIRENPDKYGIDKVTETAINNTIIKQPIFIRTNQKVIEAQYEFNIIRAAVIALEAKRGALENLVRLFGLQYFAGPKSIRNISAEWDKVQRQKRNNRLIGNKG